jgi:hydroxymethylbilane synthase
MPSALPILRLGTRASPLAMAQAHLVRDALCAAHQWEAEAVLIVPMIASGDRVLDRALSEIGGKALWTKELDVALLGGGVDLAVHSMKDVETIRPLAIEIIAMMPRADVRDRLIGAESIAALPQGARVGTSSPRRSAQLRALRPDLEIVLFRGNVGTRLGKLKAGEAHATLLAAAGLDRLGMADIGNAIPTETMLPAPAQGAIGIEVRSDDMRSSALVSAVNHAATYDCVMAERALLAALSADCQSPVAALAQVEDGRVMISAEILLPDGSERVTGAAPGKDAKQIAQDLLSRASPALRALFGG